MFFKKTDNFTTSESSDRKVLIERKFHPLTVSLTCKRILVDSTSAPWVASNTLEADG